MTKRTVVTRTGRARPAGSGKFNFTRDMMPVSTENISLNVYREKAWEIYEKLPLPSTSEEAWRRTDLKSLPVEAFRLERLGDEPYPPLPEELRRPPVEDRHGGQMLILPDRTVVRLEAALAAQGVIFADFITASRDHPLILERVLGKIVRADEGKFAALAAAFADDGALVYVPKNVQVQAPLHSVLWGPGGGKAYFSHLLICLEEGASLTYIHEAASPNEAEGETLHAGLVEIHVGEGAHLRFVELQSWGEHVWNFTHERARVERDGSLDWIFGDMGSRLSKSFSELDLVGPGASGRMSGFYFTNGLQHLDHDTQQNHLAPNTTSDLLFKGALKGASRSVWQGMIYVAPNAQKADGYQANRNLVLSSQARADSIPGLEILADDVRCTHGATVGKIDETQIFYLLSRGIPREDAERLIVEGFFEPIMQRIPFEGVRERFQQAIRTKLDQ